MRLEFALEVLARREFHGFGLLDFDFFAGLRVDAHAGGAFDNLKSAEADELDGFAFLEAGFDAVDDGGDAAFRLRFAAALSFLDEFY